MLAIFLYFMENPTYPVEVCQAWVSGGGTTGASFKNSNIITLLRIYHANEHDQFTKVKEEKGWPEAITISGQHVNAFQIRIWARRKAIDDKQGHYALNVTGPILQFYEHYYNARYPLSKSGWWTLHHPA